MKSLDPQADFRAAERQSLRLVSGLLNSRVLAQVLWGQGGPGAAHRLTDLLQEDWRREYRSRTDSLLIDDQIRWLIGEQAGTSALTYGFEPIAEQSRQIWWRDGDHIVPRKGRLWAAQSVGAWVHPWAMVSADLVEELSAGKLGLGELRQVARVSLPYGGLPSGTAAMDDPAADLHVHFNGVIDDNWLLAAGLFNACPPWAALRTGNRVNPGVGDGLDGREAVEGPGLLVVQAWALQQILCYRLHRSAPALTHTGFARDSGLLQRLAPQDSNLAWLRTAPDGSLRSDLTIAARLMELAKAQMSGFGGARPIGSDVEPKASAALLLWFCALHCVVKSAPLSTEARLARLLFHTVHRWRSLVVMGEGRGLERFVSYFDSAARRLHGLRGVGLTSEVLRSMAKGGASAAEIKVSPDAVNVRHMAQVLRGGLNASLRKRRSGPSVPQDLRDRRHVLTEFQPVRWGVHFLKRADRAEEVYGSAEALTTRTNGFRREVRFHAMRRQLRQQTTALHRFLFTPLGRQVPTWRIWGPQVARQWPQALLDLGGLVTHLDAAGLETRTPIEVFAPALIALRSGGGAPEQAFTGDVKKPKIAIPRLLPKAPNLPKRVRQRKGLGLSVHAGEYFRHLVSGMRAMDETLNFLHVQEGDRIGHALAVGLEPESWLAACDAQGAIGLGEWLDNCVWLYHRGVKLAKAGFGEACDGLLPVLAAEVRRLCLELWEEEHDIYVLWRAWQFRERDSLVCQSNGPQFEASQLDPAVALWRRWQLDPLVRRRAEAVVSWRLAAGPARTHWLRFWRAVQDDLLFQCIRAGVILEINPSSNLRTAGHWFSPPHDLAGHPVFRWKPPGDANNSSPRPLLVLGSDDPGIFMTGLAREYALLREAAESKGYSPANIQAWLTDIRQQGLWAMGHRAQWPQALHRALNDTN